MFSLAAMTRRCADFDHIKPLSRLAPFEGCRLTRLLSTSYRRGNRGDLRGLSNADVGTPVVTNPMTLC